MRIEVSEDNYESMASDYVDEVGTKAKLLSKCGRYDEARTLSESLVSYIENHHNLFHEDQKAMKLLAAFL